MLKCSHLFNLLDARGAISVTERVGVIKRVRDLAVGTAKIWTDQQSAGGERVSDFLLEIGTEEIPHWMVPGALEQLAKLDLFGAQGATWTRRRAAWWCGRRGCRSAPPDAEQVLKGPPLTSGDKAAEGFAKKQGADVSALRKAGNYYELVKRVEGRPVRDILAETLPAAILGLQWPKTMYWTGGKTGPRFIRPIRWMVALLGDQVIPFEIAGVKTGNVTRGHRILGSASIPVTTANYEAELRKNCVILSSNERRKKIEAEAMALGAKIDPELRETLTFITECPVGDSRRLQSRLSRAAG